MRDQLRQLYCLQQLTRQAAEARHEIQKLSAGIELQKEILEEKKRRAEEVHSRRIAAAREADATQLKIDEAEQEIERLKVQLNTTRHQKEYDALQHALGILPGHVQPALAMAADRDDSETASAVMESTDGTGDTEAPA